MRFFTGYSSPIYWGSFSKDLVFRISVAVSFLTNVVIWVLFAVNTDDMTALSALHYNIYFGIDLLKPWYYIFGMPVLGLVVTVFNFFLALLLYRRERLLSYFLMASAAIVNLIILLSGVFIIFVLYS